MFSLFSSNHRFAHANRPSSDIWDSPLVSLSPYARSVSGGSVKRNRRRAIRQKKQLPIVNLTRMSL